MYPSAHRGKWYELQKKRKGILYWQASLQAYKMPKCVFIHLYVFVLIRLGHSMQVATISTALPFLTVSECEVVQW